MIIADIELTEKQFAEFKYLFNAHVLTEKRKAITLYKASDPSFALFRTQATTMLLSISVKKFMAIKLNKKETKFLDTWLNDANEMFKEYFNALDQLILTKE